MPSSTPFKFPSWATWLCVAAIAIGIGLRLWRITANEFLFYDEGMYLSQNRSFLELIAANPPHNIQEFGIILGLLFKAALSTPKALWFFLLNLRVFITGPEAWAFARVVSATAGIATIVLTYLFARRYFQSTAVGLLSAAILSLLPSHVFYSRLGMQESLSALLFLGGISLYVFSGKGVSWRSCISAVCMSAVFFTNYRMIVAPVFIVMAQLCLANVDLRKFDARKFTWFLVVFFGLIFGFGALYGGANTYVNFAWMFHQADESQSYRHWTNLASFPYYFFVLEGVVFGLLFFANSYFLLRRNWPVLLPFVLSITQMLIFSFAAEKGARYLCVVLPFAAMAAAYALTWACQRYTARAPLLYALTAAMFLNLLWYSFELARARTDYGKAVSLVLAHDPAAKILSTQPVVESLFLSNEKNIAGYPVDPNQLAALVSQGYRYLILDPQVYISWTADGSRFTAPLTPTLEAVKGHLKPVAVLPHINGVLLKRFVLDHNQDLMTSLKFLANPQGKGEIYIYELR